MANQWFYTVGGKKTGPLSFGQLQAMAQSGQLKPTDLVQQVGTGNWVAVLTVEGLVPKPAKVEVPQSTVAEPPKGSITNAVGNPMKNEAIKGGLLHQYDAVKKGSQDPILTAVASFLLPPLGQLLLGQTTKAIVLFICFPVLMGFFATITLFITETPVWLLIFPVYSVAMAADAFLNAKKLTEGKSLGKWEFFAQWSPY